MASALSTRALQSEHVSSCDTICARLTGSDLQFIKGGMPGFVCCLKECNTNTGVMREGSVRRESEDDADHRQVAMGTPE